MVGKTISNFRILKKLGEGGMGVVYKAEDLKLERSVAIKFLPREIAAQEDTKKRFTIEAKAAAALNHSNIATIHQIEEIDGELFIVMEYVEGQELRQLMRAQGMVPVDDAINYAMQIAEGLQAAHQKGVVHRDIKGANIMITENDQVKIMDFGLAKLAGQSQLTKEGTMLGTVAYMSPEQVQGTKVDHRTDIWSFGVVLYEMLYGQLPFQAEYEQAIIYSIVHEDPGPIVDLQDGSAEGLQQVLDRALAKEPDDRYQLMADLLTDLRTITGETKTGPVRRAVERHTVGREKELTELQTALQNVFAGQSLLMGVAGEPGIGKTALVEQFLDEVTIGGRACLISQGQCSERLAGTEAYLPFLEVLEGLLQEEADVPVANLMREKAPWWYVQVASLSPDDPANANLLADVRNATQERVKRELAAFLQDLSGKRPLVLFFEDLHWSDVSSIDMLAYLAAKFDAMRLLIVTTYRPEEMQLTKHPFLQIKPDMLARNRCQEISLGFLPQQEIEHYLTLEFPENTFPKTFAKLIHDKTEGSPLFMVDLLQDLKNRSVIVEEDDRWQLVQSVEEIDLGLPDSVKGMIERKIKQLNEDDHQLMVVASVQGFEFDSAVVGKVLEMDEEEVEDGLQKLEQDHRFVQFTEEDEFPDHTLTLRYRFVHALYQNELYSSLTRTKRARLSRTAAETLERFYGEKSSKVAAELASLYETARNFEKAVGYLNQATEHAHGVFAYLEAIALACRGLDLLVTLPESRERDQHEMWLQSLLGASWCAIKGYAYDAVGTAYARAYELSKKLGINAQNAVAFFTLAGYFNVSAQLDNSLPLAEELLDLAQQEKDQKLFGATQTSFLIIRQFLGDFIPASMHFEQVMQINEAEGPGFFSMRGLAFDVMVYSLGHGAWNTWIIGYPDRALRQSAQAKSHAEETENPFHIAHYFGFAGFLYQSLGDVENVHDICEKSLDLSEENALHFNVAWTKMQKGWALAVQGNPQKGIELLKDGIGFWQAAGAVCFVPYWHTLIAETLGKLGQPQEALTLLKESFEIVNKTNHRMHEAELYRFKGEMLLQKDEAESEAEDCYEQALAVARKQEAKSFELRAAMSLSRLWQSQGKNKQAKEMLNKVYNWFTEGFETRDLQEAKQLLAEL